MPLFSPPRGCDACALKEEWPHLLHPRMPVVEPEEPTDIRILVIGEGPGETEDDEGCPFVGKSGQLLREHIPSYWKKKLYWTNMVRCRPPANRTPTAEEVRCCSTYLEEDIVRIQPHAILAVGGVALDYFCPGRNISTARGILMPTPFYPADIAFWMQASLHPAYVLRGVREMPDGSYANPALTAFVNDLNKFFAAAASFQYRPQIPAIPTVLLPKSYDEATALFYKLNHFFTVDIETFGKKPYLRGTKLCTVAFSDKHTTFAIPTWWPGLIDDWGMRFFKNVFTKGALAGQVWAAHNAAFELAWIQYITGARQKFFDTMVLARLVHSRKGILSLADQTRFHLGFDVKTLSNIDTSRILEYPLEKILTYNGLDAWSTNLLETQLLIKLPIDQDDNYSRILKTIASTTEMELLGLDLDLEESRSLDENITIRCDEAKSAIAAQPEVLAFQTKYAKPFLVSSPQDVATVLTEFCGCKLPETEKGNYRTGEDVLRKLADLDVPLAQMTLDYREMKILKSTFIDPILKGEIVGVDGRLHPSFTVVHTWTGRLSSEDPNIQNFPKRKHKEIRKQIVAPKGYFLLSCDYGQLEARVIAMASKDINLTKAFIAGEDIHQKWLDRILEVYPPYFDSLKIKTNQTETEKVLKAARDVIKFDFVFASFFGSDAYACASRTGMPLKVAEEILDEFWGKSNYSGVKEWINLQFKNYAETGILQTLTGYKRDDIVWGNEPINTPAQGTAEGVIVLEAQNAIYDLGLTDAPLLPRINIHDDLSFFIPDSSDTDRYINVITNEMVKPRFDFITVPLQVEPKIGYNWMEGEKVGKWEGEYYAS